MSDEPKSELEKAAFLLHKAVAALASIRSMCRPGLVLPTLENGDPMDAATSAYITASAFLALIGVDQPPREVDQEILDGAAEKMRHLMGVEGLLDEIESINPGDVTGRIAAANRIMAKFRAKAH